MAKLKDEYPPLFPMADTMEGSLAKGKIVVPDADRLILCDADGVIKKTFGNRKKIPGKMQVHSMHIRSMDNNERLTFEGAISGCKFGQNLYALGDVRRASMIAAKQALRVCGEHEIRARIAPEDIFLDRVDLVVNFRLESEEEVLRVLKQIKRQLIEQHGPTNTHGSTVCWAPKDGKEYMIVMYAKGRQLLNAMQRRKQRPPYWGALVEEATCILRVEVRVRRGELRKLGLEKASDWHEDTASKVFNKYFGNLKLLKVTSSVFSKDELTALPQRLRPVLALHKLGFDLEQVYTPRSCQRHRDFFRKQGVDLRCPSQPENTTMSVLDYLSPDKAVCEAPEWMIKQGLAPRNLAVSALKKIPASKLQNKRKRRMF
ncbi:MAG: phage/plasmid replication protein [Gallionella sp.]|nr:phage/plasmid replication protein [Gallionella sp.]